MNEPATGQQEPAFYGRDEVVQIINSVIARFGDRAQPSRETILSEMRALKAIIEDARRDLCESGAADIRTRHIPSATDELDAVVAATAEATGIIMDMCDEIQAQAGLAGGAPGQAIADAVIRIYEACSFQDITGQRITKVVTTLQAIESKIGMLVGAADGQDRGHIVPGSETRTGDAALLNGPQLPGQGITQSDIDRLLAEFG